MHLPGRCKPFSKLGDLFQQISDVGIKNKVDGISGLYANPPTTSIKGCADKDINKSKYSVSEDGRSFTISNNGDLATCAADKTSNIRSGTFKIFQAKAGVSCDFSALSGKAIEDTLPIDFNPCPGTEPIARIFHFMLEWNKTFSDGSVVTYKSISSKAGKDGGPITSQYNVADMTTIEDGAVSIYKLVSEKTLKPDGTEDSSMRNKTFSYNKLTYNNVVEPWDGESPFFQSGTVDVVIDNWSGSATYTDKETAPSWTLSNGSKTVTGVFLDTDE